MPVRKNQVIPAIILMLSIPAVLIPCLYVLKNVFIAFLVYYAGFGILLPFVDRVLIGKKSLKGFFEYLGFTANKKAIAAGFITGLLIYGIIVSLSALLKDVFFEGNTIMDSIREWGIDRSNIPFVFVIMLLCNGCMEEILWRGYFHRKLESVGNRMLAILLANLVFSGQHIAILMSFITNAFTVCLFLAAVFTGGVVWGLIREYTKSVFAPVISHMFATAGYMTVFYLFILRL